MDSSAGKEVDGVQAPGEDVLLSVRELATHFTADEGVIRAVDGVSFDVKPGTIVGLVGETGCGKSVVARSILRIVEKPGSIVGGDILLRRGDDWLNLAELPPYGPDLRKVRGGEIGLVFQDPMASFSPVHTIGSQLVEAVRLHERLDRRAADRRVAELLDLVGVPNPERVMSAYAWQISGGQRQRVMIAMALAGRPKLLIADEPTTALDVITQGKVLNLIRDLQERTGLAILLITHDLGVVAQMAEEVIVMYLGRVVEKGPVDQIFHAPQHPYTRSLLNLIPSTEAVARQSLKAIRGTVPHPLNRPDGCGFHPRCDVAIEGRCDKDAPALQIVGNDHTIECHLGEAERAKPCEDAGRRLHVVPVGDGGTAADRATVPAGDRLRPLLQVDGLNKSFPVRGGVFSRVRGKLRAVDDVAFELYEGETLALVGESGSGKTTTSRCIMRSHDADSGRILFRSEGEEMIDLARLGGKQLRPYRSQLQMIFQDPYSSLNPRMTVFDIINEPLLVNGHTDREENAERVKELMDLVGLRHEYLRRFPHAFSGGQRQRIGIARALALNPRLIVADEPVSALDVSVQAQILNLLLRLQEQLGLTYLFVSHNLGVVGHISDRIAVMYAGQIVELGSRDEVLTAPKHPYTAALLAAVPKPDPRLRQRPALPPGAVADLADPPSGCYFHPRCAFAVDRCKVEAPELETIAAGRSARCHRGAELDLTDAARLTEPVRVARS
ncbi:ABC transporter ATP-binding protein [Kribbella shirazensis]|uniref:Peptide/nickel transport system ATP-binding protein n=1 Tax=Kribbella shirazensis TaxID=1105143 RepID=A0A7X5VHP9_9ACTN|nr:ABC transporter ATP-binding protein [Kribbella shirazensis]NIK61423.1 peptide/nickel transport system ATP-binding protein [Kribbella shirazensis]